MTVIEAAARLDISYDFCLRLIRQGELKGSKTALRQWFVDPRSVEARLRAMADSRARKVKGGREWGSK